MFKTRLSEMLGIKYPVLQGGMAWSAYGELVAAVSEAGGLGIIGSGQETPEWLRGEIQKVRSRTDAKFGVNILLESPYAEANLKVIVEEKVPVITTGAGNPGKYIAELKENNVMVIPVVSSVALAKRLERAGADALVAEGTESGGHVGESTTMTLVPQVVDAVKVPVIAAGGIGDGRGFLAALALGAEGVQMGTRFLCARECTIHSRVKERIIKAGDRDTVVTGRNIGNPVRVINNKFSRKFEEMERRSTSVEELRTFGSGKLRVAMREGDIEYGSVMAGQIAGLIKEEKTAAEILEDLVREAEKYWRLISSLIEQ